MPFNDDDNSLLMLTLNGGTLDASFELFVEPLLTFSSFISPSKALVFDLGPLSELRKDSNRIEICSQITVGPTRMTNNGGKF